MPHDEFIATIEGLCADKALWQIFDVFQDALQAKLIDTNDAPICKAVSPQRPSEEAIAVVILQLLKSS